MTNHNTADKPTLSERLLDELRHYVLVTAYLFVCFSVLLLFKESAGDVEQGSVNYGLALVKALVLGKFLLIGEVINAGSRADAQPLLHRVIWKSLALLVVLIVLVGIEELVVGWFHDQTLAQTAAEFLERRWLEDLAPTLLMLLVLIPLVGMTEIYRQLGPEKFRALWLERPGLATAPTDP
jgi:hypothetical protein